MDDSAQGSTEYLLLVAMGLAVILVGIGVALQLRSLSDLVVSRVRVERNNTLSMLVR